MRLWTIHPRYLDGKGLVALWREALLAKAVLSGRTRGYHHHPQLSRFRAQPDPIRCVDTYLAAVHGEACARGYRFDGSKIGRPRTPQRLAATTGQLAYEWRHLRRKLRTRSPAWEREIRAVVIPDPHPLFMIVPGPVAPWERARARLGREDHQ
jgi:hypothetical protein